jgi:hypothetical protein
MKLNLYHDYIIKDKIYNYELDYEYNIFTLEYPLDYALAYK